MQSFQKVDTTFESLNGDTNKLYECTMALAANVTELPETQMELINCRGQLLLQSLSNL